MTSILLHEYVEQVDKLIDDNRLVEAVEHCLHILHNYPRHIDTYRVMGKALLEKHEYHAANDLFLRILSADPNDFISHVGLSIIYKEERQLEQALWHLERAFEIQPYNGAIQGELRQLYAQQTENRPGIIPLTPGALARLYMQGELYQQAVAELRRILAEEPDRIDLQVLLAEALWRDDQRIDAEEACLKVLEELPNCLVLNAILAEIWLQTGRIPEAQKYLRRLHGLTWQTRKSLDKETIAGRAFATDGAFALPDEARLDFLQTGLTGPGTPAKPTADWVREVAFDNLADEDDSLDPVVLEPESGMHSYDWLADIGETEQETETAVSDQTLNDSDWFSQKQAKESLNLSTGELNAEWLADLRGDDTDSGFQPLDLEGVDDETIERQATDGLDWFAAEDEISDEAVAAADDNLDDTAVTSQPEEAAAGLPDWLDSLAEDESALEIDSTSLMGDSLADWASSGPHVVEEPKTPFWLSEMADEELDAVQIYPEDALDWLNAPADDDDLLEQKQGSAGDDFSDEAFAEEDLSFLDEIERLDEAAPPDEESEFGPTAVLDLDELEETEREPAPTASATDALGDADDWLAALTEGGIDDAINWDEFTSDQTAETFDDFQFKADTEEFAALSDADDWLQSAASDLDAILNDEPEEIEEEFPNLAIPELEGDDITHIPGWLNQKDFDLSEEAEAAVSSENDPEKMSQPEEPEIEPTGAQEDEQAELDALDWLDDLSSEPVDEEDSLSEPPIDTEGMPSWLAAAKEDSAVEVVDEWDSASADIPDWLQDPVDLADLDDDALFDQDENADIPGLTGLLSEMNVADEALPLDQMDSLFADWVDEDRDDSLSELLDDMATEESLAVDDSLADDDFVEPTAVPAQPEQPEEIGLTGLLSNLTLDEPEAAEPDDDFLSEFLQEADDDLSGFLRDDPLEFEADDALGLADLDQEDFDDFSLTAMLSDRTPQEEEAETPQLADEDWLADLASLTDAETELEADTDADDEALGLTGMLANLWPQGDEADDTAVPHQEFDAPGDDDLGLTELLAGIDYEEEALASETNLEEFDLEPAEPSLTQMLSGVEAEPEADAEDSDWPVSAEDTTWLTQLEADTGALREQSEDDFDMAEETGLDWLTTPDEPVAEAEAPSTAAPEVPQPEPVEPDGTADDWDDAMSWLEELAAQQDEPVEELPSVAETMLDEELDTAAEELLAATSIRSDTDWLSELTSSDEAELELDEWAATEEETAVEPTAAALDEHAWLDELTADDAWADERPDAAPAMEPADEADETAEDEWDMADADAEADFGWLDTVVDESADLFEDETDLEDEDDETALPEEETIVTGVTDALKENDRIEAAEADLEEAMAWLDELDEVSTLDLPDEAPSTYASLPPAEPETLDDEPEPDELALALDRLEQQVWEEGVAVPTAAVFPITLSTNELNAALDWIERVETAVEPEPTAAEVGTETAVTVDDDDNDDADLLAMSEDPEAWLEQLLSDDFDMAVEMEPPPIKPSEDAMFVTGDADLLAETDEPPVPDEPLADTADDLINSLLDDVDLDDIPEDPGAAVGWIYQMVDEKELDDLDSLDAESETDELLRVADETADTAEFDADADLDLDMEDDPEAWLEQMLSGDMALDIDMEPPPIKPSEDAMFVTGDAPVLEPEVEAEAEHGALPEPAAEVDVPDELIETTEAVEESDSAAFEFDDMLDDPEAWLEQLLSDDFDMAVEMEPPPIKPSEDAMFVTDDAPSQESVVEAEPDEPLNVETDIISEIPEDREEAMAWLEQLAARQGAAIDELPGVTDREAEPEMPDWMLQDLEDVTAEPEPLLPDEDTAVTAEFMSDEGSPDEDELPDWLDQDVDNRMGVETDWLRALPEVDMETWLSAEEEATAAGPVEEIELPDTGPLTARPPAPVPDLLDDELFEPVLEPSTGSYNVDESKLSLAQAALVDGRLTEALTQYKDLVAAGSGMMTIIAELEQAAATHPKAPALSQLLGDAYMRNGQLQKALASYRTALDQM